MTFLRCVLNPPGVCALGKQLFIFLIGHCLTYLIPANTPRIKGWKRNDITNNSIYSKIQQNNLKTNEDFFIRTIILQNPKRIFKYMQQFSQLSDKIFVKRKKYFWKSSMINLSRVQTVYNGSSNRTDEYFLCYCHFWLMSGFLISLLALLSRK